MLTFRQFITEVASVTDIKRVLSPFPAVPLDTSRYGIQFILPSGKPVHIDTDPNAVHARSVLGPSTNWPRRRVCPSS